MNISVPRSYDEVERSINDSPVVFKLITTGIKGAQLSDNDAIKVQILNGSQRQEGSSIVTEDKGQGLFIYQSPIQLEIKVAKNVLTAAVQIVVTRVTDNSEVGRGVINVKDYLMSTGI